ncbi:MAG: hypothetical protein ACU843_16560, partial [Gammaproteobacteria bacterium]
MSTWTRIALVHAAIQGETNLSKVAKAFEYRPRYLPREGPEKAQRGLTPATSQEKPIEAAGTQSPASVAAFRGLRIWRLDQRIPCETEPVNTPPAYLSDPRLMLETDQTLSGSFHFPDPRPLVPRRRLRPFLLSALGDSYPTTTLDVAKIVAAWSAGRVLARLPYRKRQRWPRRLQILVDTSEHLRPYRFDFHCLCEDLRAELGAGSVTALRFLRTIGGECQDWFDDTALPGPYLEPALDTSVLVLSDLGVMARGSHSLVEWRGLGRRLYRAGTKPVTLSPAVRSPEDRFLCNLFRPHRFDGGIALPRRARNRGFQAGPINSNDLEQLLRLLAPWPLIDPGLLREIRKLLPGLSAAAEARVWTHSAVQTDQLGLRLDAQHRERYLANEAFHKPEKQRINELLREAHRAVVRQHREAPLPLRYLEALIADSLELADAPLTEKFEALLATGFQTRGSPRGVRFSTFFSAVCELVPEGAWDGRYGDLLHEIFAIGWLDRLGNPNQAISFPPKMDLNKIVWAFPPVVGVGPRIMTFRQVEGHRLALELQPGGNRQENTRSPNVISTAATGPVQPIRYSATGSQKETEISGLISRDTKFPMPCDRVSVRTDTDEFEFSAQKRPVWASAMGRDERGLFVINRADGRKLEWCEPGFVVLREKDGQEIARWGFEKGFWHDVATGGADGIDLVKPDWASDFGVDRSGVYAEFEVNGVVQRLRWLLPGTFAMGSPADEHDRLNIETRHEVILSRGFWLAEAACTQALWTAVMGTNPSHFKG